MIAAFEKVLERLLKGALSEVFDPETTHTPLSTTTAEVVFSPPDSIHLGQRLADLVLNVFLADVRENRKLRRNDRVNFNSSVGRTEAQAPARIDCHYLISAHNRSQSLEVDPIEVEHQLLYAAAAALLRHTPILVREVYTIPAELADLVVADPQSLQNVSEERKQEILEYYALDRVLRGQEIPVDVMPPEGFPKIAEFWGLMGTDARWKPLIYIIATLPVERSRRASGIPVRSIGTIYTGRGARPGIERLFHLGGRLLRRSLPTAAEPNPKPVPIAGARVRLRFERGGEPGQTTPLSTRIEELVTDSDGRFIFEFISSGVCDVTAIDPNAARAEDRERTFQLRVPPLSVDEYDLIL